MAEQRAEGVIGAVAEIQRRSLEAAGTLVERLASATAANVPTAPGPADDDAPRPGPADGPAPTAEVIDAWARLWRDSIASLAAALGDGQAGPAGEPALEVGAAPLPIPVRLRHDAPTDPADPTGGPAAEVWLHNRTPEDRTGLRVHVTPPHAHDGTRFPGVILAEPDAFDLPARSSRGVRLRARTEGAPPGTYRGIVLVHGLADQWLPFELQVEHTGG